MQHSPAGMDDTVSALRAVAAVKFGSEVSACGTVGVGGPTWVGCAVCGLEGAIKHP